MIAWLGIGTDFIIDNSYPIAGGYHFELNPETTRLYGSNVFEVMDDGAINEF